MSGIDQDLERHAEEGWRVATAYAVPHDGMAQTIHVYTMCRLRKEIEAAATVANKVKTAEKLSQAPSPKKR
jgi:hypothetical protein